MTGFLLDTNVVSELVCARPDAKVTAWIEATNEELLYLSVLTLGEIRKGVAALSTGSRRATLEAWLNNDLMVRFYGRILPINTATADRWGRICADARKINRLLRVIDGLLAATALQNDLLLVTRNTKHVSATGVQLLNPWAS